MIHQLYLTLTGLLGVSFIGLPIGMIVMLIVLGPVATGGIIRPLVTKYLECRSCLIVTAFVVASVASYWVGNRESAARCKADELAAVLRNKQFDLQREREAKANAEKRVKEIEESANERAKSDAEYIEKLKTKPACLLDDDDVGGMPDDKSRPRFKIPSIHSK